MLFQLSDGFASDSAVENKGMPAELHYFDYSDTARVGENRTEESINEESNKTISLRDRLLELILKDTSGQRGRGRDINVSSKEYFQRFAGKSIESVKVQHVDMFTGNVADTAEVSNSGLYRKLNKIHIRTRDNLVLENILFSEGEKVDPYLLSDSERILRQLPFIRDSRIYINLTPDSTRVEIIIVVQDKFPWAASVSEVEGFSSFRASVFQTNLAGTGNELGLSYIKNDTDYKPHGYEVIFRSRNIRRSFTDFTVFLADNAVRRGYGISLDRDFVSPDIKYGGNITYVDTETARSRIFADTLFYDSTIVEVRRLDGWLGRSFSLGNRKYINLTFRTLHNSYPKRPFVGELVNDQYHNRKFMALGLSFTHQEFYKSANVFLFGVTEDIPTGYKFGLQVGNDNAEFYDRQYVSSEVGFADYLPLGYTNFLLGVSSYIKDQALENLVYRVAGQYFSPLISIGNMSNRWFLNWDLLKGQNLRVPFGFSLQEGDRVRNLRGIQIYGDELYSVNLETVLYLGGRLSGFQFAPFAFSDIGMVRESRAEGNARDRFYSIGAGVRVRNENLIVNTFELRASYFPRTLEAGQSFIIGLNFNAPFNLRTFVPEKPHFVGID